MKIKTLVIKTCKSCGRSYYIGDQNIKLQEGDEIEVIETFAKCIDCKYHEERQMKSRRKRNDGNQTYHY